MPKIKITSGKGLVQETGKSNLTLDDDVLAGNRQRVITLSGAGATKTLTAADSGALVLLSGSNASTVTLPSMATSGLYFSFQAGTSFAHVIQATDDSIQGAIWDNTNGATIARNAIQGVTSITLVNPLFGDHLDFASDGSNWHVWGLLNNTPTTS